MQPGTVCPSLVSHVGCSSVHELHPWCEQSRAGETHAAALRINYEN